MKFSTILHLIRFDKPVGTLLLFLPCVFGVGLNVNNFQDNLFLLPFLIGSFAMRSAGCIINDLWDKDFDDKVERTKNRPIAVGIIPIDSALLICAMFCCLGLLMLMSLNEKAILFAFLSVPLVVIYPLMKRYTFFPQVFLGIAFNFGILIATMQLKGEITIASLVLYIGAVFWTIGYDTIYGFMDIKDDKTIGVKSLSILIEKRKPKSWLALFYGIFISLVMLAFYLEEKTFTYGTCLMLILAIIQLAWQILTVDLEKPGICLQKFKSNILAGIFIICALFLG